MIASGSLVPGIDPAAFGLPLGTALRYERPAAALRPLFPSYAVLDSDPAIWNGPGSWILPGWAKIWLVFTDGAITVQVRNREYGPLGAAVLYGDTGKAMPVSSHGGVSIVIDVSPIGWARLFGATAEALRDRITPLDELLPPAWTDELLPALHASDRAAEVKGVVDAFLARHLPPPHPEEALIARVQAALIDPALPGPAAVAERVALAPRALLTLCNRYFGYGPKVLMRRTRFLRAITAMLLDRQPPAAAALPPGYYDMPHFLRDGHVFLGLTPRRFLALPMPYLRAVLRARRLVIGEPVPLLDRLD